MSRSFFKLFTTIFDAVIFKDNRYEPHTNMSDIQTKLRIVAFMALCHCTYAMLTSKDETIIVDDKYQIVRNGSTEFMIVDNNKNHYNVNNSLWFNKWDSIEDWNRIKVGNKLVINYYGIRSPLLGLFPNIYKTKIHTV